MYYILNFKIHVKTVKNTSFIGWWVDRYFLMLKLLIENTIQIVVYKLSKIQIAAGYFLSEAEKFNGLIFSSYHGKATN